MQYGPMNSDEIHAPPVVVAFLRRIAAKGGKTTGPSKLRGGKRYYKAISKKAAAARKRSGRDWSTVGKKSWVTRRANAAKKAKRNKAAK